jgi:putative transposase
VAPIDLRSPASAQAAAMAHQVYTHRLRQAGLLGSMGRVASSMDNTIIESFWSTMQSELLDTTRWDTKHRLPQAIFEWIEALVQPATAAYQHRRPPPVAYEHHTVGDAESAV